MAYRTYTTEAIVCGTFDRNIADRSYLLFTRDAGMIYADAKSVRLEKSRQRYALQDFSIVRVSLVKGKAGWRIGSVEAIANPFLASNSRRGRGQVHQVVKLLRRFVHGEEVVPQLYADIRTCLDAKFGDSMSDELLTTVTLRMLHQLGYVPAARWSAAVLEAPTLAAALEYPLDQVQAERAIDTAVSSSHL